jgi:hypothetical protein
LSRLANVRAALGFLQLAPRVPELQLLHRWLDTWAGIGLIAVGLHRRGWDRQLTQYGDGHWRATFYVTGAAHSIVAGYGAGANAVAGGAEGGVGDARRYTHNKGVHHGRGTPGEAAPDF